MSKNKRIIEDIPQLEEVMEQPLVTEEEVEEVDAIIDGVNTCLNIRRDPEVKANNQIAILGKGTKIIVVDPKKPVKNKDSEWFKVRLHSKEGDEYGYAMKKYIKIV